MVCSKKLVPCPTANFILKITKSGTGVLSIVCEDQNRGRAMKPLLYERVFVDKAWEMLALLVINMY